jgi:hypothetical protein
MEWIDIQAVTVLPTVLQASGRDPNSTLQLSRNCKKLEQMRIDYASLSSIYSPWEYLVN